MNTEQETVTGRTIRLIQEEARAQERDRCVAIVQAARCGEIDQDFRAIISMIEGGRSVEDLIAEAE